ncbi:MAG: hypothetical protein U0667_07580 [Chloroflexota bacterium]
MRPAIRIAFLGLVIAAMIGAPASAAPGHRSPPGQRLDARAAASSARQGGTLLVLAEVRLPRRAASDVVPAVSAVVHFASGDVSVDLTGRVRSLRGGRGWWAPVRVWSGIARVPVAQDEQVGRVRVDVSVTLGDGSVSIATSGRVRPARPGHTTPPPTTDPDPDPVPCTAGCQEL